MRVNKKESRAGRLSFLRMYLFLIFGLDDTLSNHGFSNAHEAGDVGTLDVVDGTVSLLTVLDAHVIDVIHDGVEVLVDLFSGPVAVLSVLADFEARGGNTTSVDSLTGAEGHLGSLDGGDSAGLAAHVGDLSNILHAIGEEHLGIFLGELVLEGAGHSDVALHGPSLLAGGEFSLAGELGGHILNFVAVAGTHLEHVVDHFFGDTVGDFADTVGAADSDDLGTKLSGLDSSAPSDVTEAGEGDTLAFHLVTFFLDHALEVFALSGSFVLDACAVGVDAVGRVAQEVGYLAALVDA